MTRSFLKFAIILMIVSLFYSIPVVTQVSPITKKAARVEIMKGPEPERIDSGFAIIRWTTNNPGGSPEHFGIVRYGTDPKNLSEAAKSEIRLNPDHPQTVFRVRMESLKPRTTYYYTVGSIEANGKGDGVTSAVKRFTTR